MAKKNSKEQLTVVQLAKELEIDPKKARGKLRRAGWSAEGKRYAPMERGGAKFKEAVEILSS